MAKFSNVDIDDDYNDAFDDATETPDENSAKEITDKDRLSCINLVLSTPGLAIPFSSDIQKKLGAFTEYNVDERVEFKKACEKVNKD